MNSDLNQPTLCSILLTHVEHSIVKSTAHQELKTEVVNALGIAISLSLLSSVPIKDQAITESQAGSRVGSMLIAVEDRAGKSGLDVADNLFLEAVFTSKATRLVALPCFTLRFGN
jgi:hypothetical protein